MSESQIKSGRKKGFVVLFRSAAQDNRLSLEARGLFALMISLPENWEYSVTGLAKKAGCGREKARRLLRELQTVGYLAREQSHDAGGQFSGAVYVLQDEAPPLDGFPGNGEAENAPLPEKPTTDEPSTAGPSTGVEPEKNKELKTPEEKEPPKAPQGAEPAPKKRRAREWKPTADWKPERFEAFWAAYPCGRDRQAAIRAWDKLRPGDDLIHKMALGLKQAMAREDWKRGIGIPYASTWINNRRWEDTDKPLPGAPGAAGSDPARTAPRLYHIEIIDGEEVTVYD